jgi:hypothetical protein
MPRVFLRFLLFALLASPSRADNLLFFGNSFTFAAEAPAIQRGGGVPKLVEAIARAKGHDVTTTAITFPGVDWSFHLARFRTAWALRRTWSWVVLQDFSTRPTHLGNIAQFMADGETFSQRIALQSPHAGILLYETWARPPGAFYQTSPGNGFTGPAQMMAELHQSYAQLRDKLAAENPHRPVRVAPVGTAFARCHAEHPEINLDAADHHHATAEGYYLAALVIEETLYGESAKDAPSDFFHSQQTFPPDEGAKLQQVADEVVGR